MTNIVDFNKKLQDKKDLTNSDWATPHPDFQFGAEWMIMGFGDQMRFINGFISSSLRTDMQNNIKMLDLTRILDVVQFLFQGLVLPFGGVKVTVNTRNNGDPEKSTWMVSVTRSDMDHVHECMDAGTTPQQDFELQVWINEEEEFENRRSFVDISKIEFYETDFSTIAPTVGRTFIERMNEIARINDGFTAFTSMEDNTPTVMAMLPFAKSHFIAIALSGNFRKKNPTIPATTQS